MKQGDTETFPAMSGDKQLLGISLEAVLQKRGLGQALNAKEFAVCVGVSYSKARGWFRLPGFPSFCGVVFWQDFVTWRSRQFDSLPHFPRDKGQDLPKGSNLPPRAAQILLEA